MIIKRYNFSAFSACSAVRFLYVILTIYRLALLIRTGYDADKENA